MQKDAAIRKRTQIAKANRTMFVWIAGASALVGFAIVTSIFLGQKLIFNERVLAEKNKTITTLNRNIKVVPDLESQVRVLNTNAALATVKADSNDQAIQVILDALPADANSSALGASLQQKLFAGIEGLTIDSLQVTPVAGVESLGGTGIIAEGNAITFHAVLIGNQANFRQALLNLERSIRIIDVTALHITSAGTQLNMTIDGAGFYEPATTIQLEEKVIKS